MAHVIVGWSELDVLGTPPDEVREFLRFTGYLCESIYRPSEVARRMMVGAHTLEAIWNRVLDNDNTESTGDPELDHYIDYQRDRDAYSLHTLRGSGLTLIQALDIADKQCK
jgi:hypothetical protein